MIPPVSATVWTRRRFWSLVLCLFVAQAGLIALFARHARISYHEPVPTANFRVMETPLTDDELSRTFFALDPTVFLLPGPHGFSERAWMEQPTNQFQPPNETEDPAWLPLNVAQLGTNFARWNQVNHFMPSAMADQHSPELEPWPASLTPDLVRTQSRFHLEGDLSRRQLNPIAFLPARTNAQLLANTVVQLAVDSAGMVIAARLLLRSGSGEADTNALAHVRNLRFRPVPAQPPTWGRAVFEWQTAEPANLSASASP